MLHTAYGGAGKPYTHIGGASYEPFELVLQAVIFNPVHSLVSISPATRLSRSLLEHPSGLPALTCAAAPGPDGRRAATVAYSGRRRRGAEVCYALFRDVETNSPPGPPPPAKRGKASRDVRAANLGRDGGLIIGNENKGLVTIRGSRPACATLLAFPPAGPHAYSGRGGMRASSHALSADVGGTEVGTVHAWLVIGRPATFRMNGMALEGGGLLAE